MTKVPGVEVVIGALDRITAPLKALNDRIDRIQAPVRRLRSSFVELDKALGLPRLRTAVAGVASGVAGVASAAAGAVTQFSLMATAGAGALLALVKTTADTGESVFNAAQKVGVAVEAYQRLAYAAGIANVSHEGLDTALKIFSKNLTQAARGGKEQAAAFASIGVGLRDARGQIKPTETLLQDIADRFQKMPDGPAKTAIALRLFGRSGSDLIPLLNEGGSALRAYGDELDRIGGVLGKDTASAADTLNDNISRLMAIFNGFRLMVGSALMPVANELVETMRSLVLANADAIRARLAEWAGRAAAAVRSLLDPTSEARKRLAALWERVQAGVAFLDRLSAMVGGPFNAAMIAIAAVILGPVVTALAALTLAFTQLGIALAATPIGWFIAGVAAIAAAGYLIYRNWGSIAGFFAGVWDQITTGIERFIAWAWGGLVAAAGSIADAFTARWRATVAEAVGVWTGIRDAFTAGVAWLQSLDLGEIGAGIIGSLWRGMVAAWERVASWLRNLAVNPAKAATDAVRPPVGPSAPVAATPGLVAGASPATGLFGPRPAERPTPLMRPAAANDNATARTVNGGAMTVNAPINITVSGGGDPNAIGAAVEQALQRSMRAAESERRAALHD
jgi:TP901 family phage tail tape measure protein